MANLDEMIRYCDEVAEKQEDFDNFQCDYCKVGCEDGVWKETCRLPSNIPLGCSWGECSEQNCPLFPAFLEGTNNYRQIAEWLKRLKRIEDYIADGKDDIECTYSLRFYEIEAVMNGEIWRSDSE